MHVKSNIPHATIGPDSVGNVTVSTPSTAFQSHVLASVLSLRGKVPIPQPRTKSTCGGKTSTFCWNGEIYRNRNHLNQNLSCEDDHGILNDSDTLLMSNLVSELGFREALSHIDGEFASLYIESDHNNNTWTAWMTRDRLGRRSLVWHREADIIIVSSVPPVYPIPDIATSEHESMEALKQWNFKEMPSDSIFSLQICDDELQWSRHPHTHSLPKFNRELPQLQDIVPLPEDMLKLPNVLTENDENALDDSMKILSEAVRVRVLTSPTPIV